MDAERSTPSARLLTVHSAAYTVIRRSEICGCAEGWLSCLKGWRFDSAGACADAARWGGLFFLGDAHAVQGDGEISGNGVEISTRTTVELHLLKGYHLEWPRLIDQDGIATIGNARPLDQATQHATTEMLRWLIQDAGLDATGASLWLQQCVRYDIGNIFDPAYTMACRLPRAYWPPALRESEVIRRFA